MSEQKISVGKRAYKLYNRVGATEENKQAARDLLEFQKPEALDVYGKFVRAEMVFWGEYVNGLDKEGALATFQRILLDEQSPKVLQVGASFFIARCYELGFGTACNKELAYAHYRLANKLNPKACLKDISRLEKGANTTPIKKNTSTPDEFKYHYYGDWQTAEWEYEDNLREWAREYERCQRSLANNGFFYAADPDEVNVDDIPLDARGHLPPIDEDDD